MIEGKCMPTRTGMVFATDPVTGQTVCVDQGHEIDARDVRIAELEAENRELKMQALADVGQWQEAAERIDDLTEELAGWKRVAVEAAIPLEVIVGSGWAEKFTPSLQDEIRSAVETIRRAVKGGGPLPPTPRSLTEGEKP